FYWADSPSEAEVGFAELVQRITPDLRSYLQGLSWKARIPLPCEIDDLIADTWTVVLKSKSTVERRYDPERGPCRAWLYGIASNLFADVVRRVRRQRETTFPSDPIASSTTPPEVDAHREPQGPVTAFQRVLSGWW